MKFITGFLLLTSMLPAFSQTSSVLSQGLVRPESAYVLGDTLYISNQSGPGTLKDGVGWIQKLDLKGNVLSEKWVEGLNAPKGLRAFDGKLYAGDIDELAVIDLQTGTYEKVPFPGAKLLNDVAIDASGTVYVADTYGSKVYRYDPRTKEISVVLELDQAPNGVLQSGDLLYVAASGKVNATATGIEAGSKGSVLTFNLSTGELKTLVPELGYLDGIELTREGQLLVSAKQVQALYWIDVKDGKILGSLQGTSPLASFTDVADIGYDAKTGTVYVPNTNFHNVQVIQLKR